MVGAPDGPALVLHEVRQLAESFGTDPERYDRLRPRHPQAMVERIVGASPGNEVLDVGIGTGIVARAFVQAGCSVLGVDPDVWMAAYARSKGFVVEVATFEGWEPAGRRFDAVVVGQTWHWVDPMAGAVKAAQVLRPAGRLAVFWNAMEFPPLIGEAFGRAVREAVPSAPGGAASPGGRSGYAAFFAKAADAMRESGAYDEPEQWEIDWVQRYTRQEWLDVMPTAGGFNRLDPETLVRLQAAVGAAIDEAGGSFAMNYATVAVTAVRSDRTR